MKIELLLTVLSNFERGAPLKDSAFWWVACLTHKVLSSVYSLVQGLAYPIHLLAFKWLLNVLLLETEWLEVMLIWWFVSIKLIRSFLKYLFIMSLFKWSPGNLIFTGKTIPYPSTDIIMVALCCFLSVFLRKVLSFFFSCQFFK